MTVRDAFARIAASGRPEVWISLRDEAAALADAERHDTVRTLAVKDNIDVAGLDTTAACPAFAYRPERSAPAVERLEAAGAVVLGKTNLDQFATGLVGTRSPYGAVRDARRPEYVSGGSSSGSAVAVALGLADLGLGTDTAGSGRVPAAFGGIVGVKPTRGLVPTTGVVPACRSFDCVTVFARTHAEAHRAFVEMAALGEAGGLGAGAPLGAPPAPHVAVPSADGLAALTPAAREAFAAAAKRLAATGAELVELDLDPFLATGRMLYDGAFVAERHAAVGAFVDAHPDAVDPTVGAIISAAGAVPASALAADAERLDAARAAFSAQLAGLDALLVPTTTEQPTIEEVRADPFGANARLGVYTNACNLLDLCAVAVPAGEADRGCFGVTLMAPAFRDLVVADLAQRFLGEPPLPAPPAGVGADLLVVGAHLTGMPLNGQLVERGARLVATTSTAPEYRLFALDTEPPKPGLVRSAEGGASIEGELWRLPPAGLASLLVQLPPPMGLGPVRLVDGSTVVGFMCEAFAIEGAEDITAYGGWRAYATTATNQT